MKTEKEKNEYRKARELEIEKRAVKKASHLLGIPEEKFVWIQQETETRKAVYERVGITFTKTPDFAITDGTERHANQLLLVEANEPGGGLLRDLGVGNEINEAMKTAPLSNGMDGKVNRVIFNKPDTTFNEEVINKIKKTQQKYSFNRSSKCPESISTGLIFCMGDTQNELNKLPEDSPFYFNLSHGQFMPLVINSIFALSGGKLNSKEAIGSRKKVLKFEFCDDYKLMGFVMFIGGDSAENYDFLFVNTRFLRANRGFLSKKLEKMTELKES
ncbi:hypothetical protein ACVT98_09755 [Vibrio campbellii]